MVTELQSEQRELADDPDAVFYKRKVTADTHSPVIPFYWGFREDEASVTPGDRTKHGQALDRDGNRLDKDYSKGGGPFANATNNLPDMWNRGKGDCYGALDAAQADATHPVLKNPGRLYMILAARRLAALITMIRDYHEDETVSIVAHSQGCMLSLLAQAFLLDSRMLAEQVNARPADTLILCNPPYSLVDEMPVVAGLADGYSGSDAVMEKRYESIEGGQTLHARLTTLVNIVKGVHQHKHAKPGLAEMPDAARHCGVVGGKWVAEKDRDNRGKVYLYFSPEDMTVALANVQGIGWQGVPEYARGTQLTSQPNPFMYGQGNTKAKMMMFPTKVVRRPLAELGAGFFQRVFTMKLRPDFQSGKQVLVGQPPPYDFALRGEGEDDQRHTAASDSLISRHLVRGRLPEPGGASGNASDDEHARFHLRKITGEALPTPVLASMCEGAFPDEQNRKGAMERVDQIDAATASTRDYGRVKHWNLRIDPGFGYNIKRGDALKSSPEPGLFKGRVVCADDQRFALRETLNQGKPNDQKCEVLQVFVCMEEGDHPRPIRPTKLLIQRTETANEARLRWQQASVARSFHGAIYGGRHNHSNVTAYDVAIGAGWAPTHPLFYAYLCAVADWRLKRPVRHEDLRPGILGWDQFQADFVEYWMTELPWRRTLIEGNMNYYSTGILPTGLPLAPEGLPSAVVTQAMHGGTIVRKEDKR